MKCQISGCEHPATMESDDGDLAVCEDHAHIEMVPRPDLPDVDPLCQCAICIEQRREAVETYRAMVHLAK